VIHSRAGLKKYGIIYPDIQAKHNPSPLGGEDGVRGAFCPQNHPHPNLLPSREKGTTTAKHTVSKLYVMCLVPKKYLGIPAAALWFLIGASKLLPQEPENWIGSWMAAQQLVELENMPPAPGLAGSTLRQVIQPALGGKKIRLAFSNLFGDGPLILDSVHVALSAGRDQIQAGTDQALAFQGSAAVTLQPGTSVFSDPLAYRVTPFVNLTVTVHVPKAPSKITGHPGSRTTSFLSNGNQVSAASLPGATKVTHWYLLSALDVVSSQPGSAVVILGDSLTDGRGSTTDQNNRWPNLLARRLRGNSSSSDISVLNAGIGGNRVLRDGLGPSALSRFDRDMLATPGVHWLVVLEGINDLGTAAKGGIQSSVAQALINAYKEMARRAHERGFKIYGATITPCGGSFYFTPQLESNRQTVNAWIRTGGAFDGVIDFDKALQDPRDPSRLSPADDGGDHLHPNEKGYQRMADAVDLKLFTTQGKSPGK
jgi:lysophospholipase L1-like esterase